MLNKPSDGPSPNKKIIQSSERHQLSTSANHMVITDSYNPLEEEANRNNLDKVHLKKLKLLSLEWLFKHYKQHHARNALERIAIILKPRN